MKERELFRVEAVSAYILAECTSKNNESGVLGNIIASFLVVFSSIFSITFRFATQVDRCVLAYHPTLEETRTQGR